MLAQVPSGAAAAGATPASTWIIVALVIVLAIVIAVAVTQRRRSQTLRDRFGPEYDRTVATTGSKQRAEAELAEREKRHKKLDIRPLTPGARERYGQSWRDVQSRFVDDPQAAITAADRLVNDVMRDRGYPVDDPARRFDDLSVEHAGVLQHYRTATDIAARNARGDADTEALRQAMVSYRALFADLLGADPVGGAGTVEERIVEPRRADTTQGAR